MANWVMVVDDDTANLKIAGTILSKNNMHVTAVKSGRAMLDYISGKGAPDLILLDIKMPEMDGFETLTRLRELEKEKGLHETPVIFLTADETTGTESRGFEVGVSDYIRKPFNPEVLLRRIDNVISMHSEVNNLKNEATLDKLTGFLNKSATGTKLTKMCQEQSGCLMMIDLDSFKLVNDIYGHEMGDRVLQKVADLLTSNFRSEDSIYRIGGDEFAILMVHADSSLTGLVRSKIMSIIDELRHPEDGFPPVTLSVGVAFSDRRNPSGDIYKDADTALYKVKEANRANVGFYE